MTAKKINNPSTAKPVVNSPFTQMLIDKLAIIDRDHEREHSAYFNKAVLLSSLIEESRKLDKKSPCPNKPI